MVVVARSDVSGEVAGASAAISRGRRSKHVFVVSVTVAREHWRRGLGGRMMRRLEEEVRWAGFVASNKMVVMLLLLLLLFFCPRYRPIVQRTR